MQKKKYIPFIVLSILMILAIITGIILVILFDPFTSKEEKILHALGVTGARVLSPLEHQGNELFEELNDNLNLSEFAELLSSGTYEGDYSVRLKEVQGSSAPSILSRLEGATLNLHKYGDREQNISGNELNITYNTIRILSAAIYTNDHEICFASPDLFGGYFKFSIPDLSSIVERLQSMKILSVLTKLPDLADLSYADLYVDVLHFSTIEAFEARYASRIDRIREHMEVTKVEDKAYMLIGGRNTRLYGYDVVISGEGVEALLEITGEFAETLSDESLLSSTNILPSSILNLIKAWNRLSDYAEDQYTFTIYLDRRGNLRRFIFDDTLYETSRGPVDVSLDLSLTGKRADFGDYELSMRVLEIPPGEDTIDFSVSATAHLRNRDDLLSHETEFTYSNSEHTYTGHLYADYEPITGRLIIDADSLSEAGDTKSLYIDCDLANTDASAGGLHMDLVDGIYRACLVSACQDETVIKFEGDMILRQLRGDIPVPTGKEYTFRNMSLIELVNLFKEIKNNYDRLLTYPSE